MSSRRKDTWIKKGAEDLGGTGSVQCSRRSGDLQRGTEMGMRGRGCGLCGALWVLGGHEDLSRGGEIHCEFRNSGVVKAGVYLWR